MRESKPPPINAVVADLRIWRRSGYMEPPPAGSKEEKGARVIAYIIHTVAQFQRIIGAVVAGGKTTLPYSSFDSLMEPMPPSIVTSIVAGDLPRAALTYTSPWPVRHYR